MKLYFFSCGRLNCKKSLFVQGASDEPYSVPVPFFLIQHRGKNILFDTGNHAEDSKHHLSPILLQSVVPVFDEAELAPNAIKKIGLTPEDIDFIILSHLHHDHAGCITMFPNATVIVHEKEYDYAHRTEYFLEATYYDDEYPSKGIDWYFTGELPRKGFDLFGDGKIIILSTPGHTIGHQSLLVNTDNNGTFLLCADACYTKANLDEMLLPGLVLDCHECLNNLKYFKLLEKTGAKIVPGHDPLTWDCYLHAPEYYD